MRPPTRLLGLASACAAALCLAGCAGGPVLGILEEDQSDEDVLTIQSDLDGIDLASTRLLGERDGIEYFAARPLPGTSDEETVCLLVEEGIGVGLECAPLERGSPGAAIRDSRVTAVLLPDDVDRTALAADGFQLLHPNLAIRPADGG